MNMKQIFSIFIFLIGLSSMTLASSHREAPMIADDPLADNVDLYAFRSPGNMITLIATYVPGQLPQGGPNYYNFGANIRYEIHIDNNVNTPGDDIVYRVMMCSKVRMEANHSSRSMLVARQPLQISANGLSILL